MQAGGDAHGAIGSARRASAGRKRLRRASSPDPMAARQFVYDLATATAVYRNRISPDPIFLTAASPTTGGFYAINRRAPAGRRPRLWVPLCVTACTSLPGPWLACFARASALERLSVHGACHCVAQVPCTVATYSADANRAGQRHAACEATQQKLEEADTAGPSLSNMRGQRRALHCTPDALLYQSLQAAEMLCAYEVTLPARLPGRAGGARCCWPL